MDRPSGAHCGLRLSPPWPGNTEVVPDARSSSVIRHGLKYRLAKLALSRSLANAIVLPSGDHCGWRSPNLSFVNRCRLEPSVFTKYRSVMPPVLPLNTIRFPSGDQVGPVIDSMPRSNPVFLCDSTSIR